ncbi:ribosome small subunit-dependent GTPase A [Acetatifactor muris]|uniref:ribosome small subunit-dependent GTPase A n=1 Tax=Acetatifactor muris TaxID=879566 RepID=UPI0023F13E31|nr:ribosome small subunit-dependent GTPase A [Acetatifactor muris]MCI8799816.1 ribosome small subunit-dependent GTPase A [Lachnospiraceae bacterium]
MRGRIVKGIGGFYYVKVVSDAEGPESETYECKAKGIFRKDNRKPLVGDEVIVDVLDREKRLGNVRELLPRHSELIRPAVANADQAVVIFSIVKPRPNFNLLDRFLIMMEQQGVDCIICFSKEDLDENGEGGKYRQIYENCGYRTLTISAKYKKGIGELRELLSGRITVAAGPSGVGKSSLINCLQSEIVMETGEISTKIERGKHTTRHSELIDIGENTYILDTPGFSSLGLFELEKEQLAGYYHEFDSCEKFCKFGGCSHINEQNCGVKEALAKNLISEIRYENYRLLYEELDKVRYRGGRRN